MIKKWRNRVIIYVVIAAFIAIVGAYIFKSISEDNASIKSLIEDGMTVSATMVKRDDVADYGDGNAYSWGYLLPENILPKNYNNKDSEGNNKKYHMITLVKYTAAEYEEMHGELLVKYMVIDDENFIVREQAWLDAFRPSSQVESIVLWVIAAALLGVAIFYLVQILIVLNILKTGEISIGTFEEAFHAKLGSSRYYKVKYKYIKDGEQATAVSPAYYDGSQVDKLKNYGSFAVRYKGNKSVIDQKL